MKPVFSRFAEVLRDGTSLFWFAPAIPAIVVIPEMIQHVAEINLGMFESKQVFSEFATDPRRMVWGVLKLAGLMIGMLAATRYWGAKSQGVKWWDLRGIAWKNLTIAIVLIIASAVPGLLLEPIVGMQNKAYVDIVLMLLTLPLVALLVAGLVGDRDTGLIPIFKSGWPASLRILIFAAAVWAPLQWLHEQNHSWALGETDLIVWALMIFDSLVVGLLAMLPGTAFHHGYRLTTPENIQ